MHYEFYWSIEDDNPIIECSEHDACYMSENEKSKGNHIESIVRKYSGGIRIQLNHMPTVITRHKKYHDLWIGEPVDLSEHDIVWQPKTIEHSESSDGAKDLIIGETLR